MVLCGKTCLLSVDTHLSATIDGLSEPDVLLALGGSVPVLLGNAVSVGIDAGLAGGEVTEDLDDIAGAALVGVNPVESYRARGKKGQNDTETAFAPPILKLQKPFEH